MSSIRTELPAISRVTLTQSLVHQHVPHGQPTEVGSASVSFSFDSDEDPYTRPGLKVTGEWTPLSSEWVKTPCAIHLANLEGRHRQTIPSKEELEELATRILELGIKCHDQNGEYYYRRIAVARPGGIPVLFEPGLEDPEGFFIRDARADPSKSIKISIGIAPGG